MAIPNGTGSTSSDPTSNQVLGNIEKWIENRDLEKGNNLVVALVGCGESENLTVDKYDHSQF